MVLRLLRELATSNRRWESLMRDLFIPPVKAGDPGASLSKPSVSTWPERQPTGEQAYCPQALITPSIQLRWGAMRRPWVRAPQPVLPAPSAQTVSATTDLSAPKMGPPLSPLQAPDPALPADVFKAGSDSQTRMRLGP